MRVKTRDMQNDEHRARNTVPRPIVDSTRPVFMKSDLHTSSADTDVSLTFDDNRLASLVFGLYDQNLAHIERRLGLQVTANGNHVVIKGPYVLAEQARHVLETLYDLVREGVPITVMW